MTRTRHCESELSRSRRPRSTSLVSRASCGAAGPLAPILIMALHKAESAIVSRAEGSRPDYGQPQCMCCMTQSPDRSTLLYAARPGQPAAPPRELGLTRSQNVRSTVLRTRSREFVYKREAVHASLIPSGSRPTRTTKRPTASSALRPFHWLKYPILGLPCCLLPNMR